MVFSVFKCYISWSYEGSFSAIYFVCLILFALFLLSVRFSFICFCRYMFHVVLPQLLCSSLYWWTFRLSALFRCCYVVLQQQCGRDSLSCSDIGGYPQRLPNSFRSPYSSSVSHSSIWKLSYAHFLVFVDTVSPFNPAHRICVKQNLIVVFISIFLIICPIGRGFLFVCFLFS